MNKVRIAIAAIASILALLAIAGASGAASSRDANRDGIPDSWEKAHGLSLKVNQAKRDPDTDGLNNWGEWRAKTDPKDPDTDNDNVGDAREDYDRDRLSNGGEISASTDPANADSNRNGTKDGDEDSDSDGLSNGDEDRIGTNPRRKDAPAGAGVVVSFDGTNLVVTLSSRKKTGSDRTLSGTVTAGTELECELREDKGRGRGDSRKARTSDSSEGDDALMRAGCLANIVAGAIVKEAKLKDGGPAFEAVKIMVVPTG